MSLELEHWRNSGNTFDHGGFDIFYRRSGSGKSVVLLLHGFPTSSFDFRKIWEPLTEQFALLSFDMIGYGFSAKPPDINYTTFLQADLLQALIKELKIEHVDILSHDYGNTITQELLARQNEGRLGFDIRSICFLNGALFPETHRPILAQKILISPLGALFGRLIPDVVFKRNLAAVFGADSQPTADELDDFLMLFKLSNGKRIAHKLIRYMAERARYRERWVAPLQAMRQPFLFINGTADPVSGKHLVDRFRELVPEKTNIVELEGIGHFPHFEIPDVVISEYRKFQVSL
jgi:pimeloyl-ACP methyl ester carboxylesterase